MPYIALLTLDIICVTSMGPSANAQEKSNSPYVQAVVKLSELLEMRSRSPWFWPDAIFNLCPPGREFNNCLKILHGFTDKVIDEQIAERAAKKLSNGGKKNEDDDQSELTSKRRLAFLDALLEAYENGEISREGVREEVDTFMFEGHDTTSAGITWALYLLGRHPVIQQRVYEEVESFFERRSNVLTVDDLKEFRFLECVLKESQRLFPSVPFFSRSTSEDCQLGQRLAFLEEKLVLAHVLRHFEIQSTQAVDDIHLCVKFVLRSKEGVFVTLVHRQKGKVA
ncbi:cytochrome P450 4C1-like isoform X2 [Porites lutea]|uniref:cytochrome P450 4C1-like isoform X2 n=1 Tax=Porites lutea TaxID=51062 RepID=UPI003CC6098F